MVKDLVRKKKIDMWNEKVMMEVGKTFVGRRSKGKKKTVGSLRSDNGVQVTSTKRKLQVLQKHYKALSRMSEDSEFDSKWREQVEANVSMWSSLLCEDDYLDGELQKGEIEKYICKLKNNKTGASDGKGVVGVWASRNGEPVASAF